MVKIADKMIVGTVTSKGQITIPSKIREMLHIASKGDMVGFIPMKEGVMIKHLELAGAKEEFSEEEWDKLEKLANRKGRTYRNAKSFLKAVEKL